ncbi:hypothetical protein LIER_11204 [Lithospermum erythrorhizon]|uniref:Uncharacterized protein n=1 Tax=Lithospermum erythrorhizon TaxID=34254 RepID=A0AAV3PPI8_LITER
MINALRATNLLIVVGNVSFLVILLIKSVGSYMILIQRSSLYHGMCSFTSPIFHLQSAAMFLLWFPLLVWLTWGCPSVGSAEPEATAEPLPAAELPSDTSVGVDLGDASVGANLVDASVGADLGESSSALGRAMRTKHPSF